MSIERERLASEGTGWKRWGPYLSERAWGTVREDYSPDGTAWDFLPHDAARSKAYRWNEDGLAGICDDQQQLCFALALWNGTDPILKERLFGLTGNEGNHGEDVKRPISIWIARPRTAICACSINILRRRIPTRNWSRKTDDAAKPMMSMRCWIPARLPKTAISMSLWSMPSLTPTTLDSPGGGQSRAGDGHHSSAAHALVSQYLGVGARPSSAHPA